MNNILLLVGSPRRKQSTSNCLGSYLLNQFNKDGFNTNKIFINPIKAEVKLVDEINKSDLVIVTFPLYVDCLPAPVIRTFTEILNNKEVEKNKKIFAISNCGFPEAKHNLIALKMMKEFSKQIGWQWLGGLAVGMGAAVNENSLINKSRIVKDVIKKLDYIYINLKEDNNMDLIEVQPSIPKWLYIFMGNMGWRYQAFKNGEWNSLSDKPYK